MLAVATESSVKLWPFSPPAHFVTFSMFSPG